MIEHPILRRFEPYRKSAEDWLGAHFPVEFPEKRPRRPPHDEELFEWIAMLESVFGARRRFVMLELGAGFGRWGIWGCLAARAIGIDDVEVRLVEAEPQHAAWASEGVRLNRLEREITVIAAAISNDPGPVPFTIDSPAQRYDAASWYGQAVLSGGQPTNETYFGRRVYRDQFYGRIYVPTVTVGKVMEGLEQIDLIDSDLQGAEIELLPWIDLLTTKVRAIYIGTHGVDIETALREAFYASGWRCQWDFPLLGERDTPFGRFSFQDGVQVWLNPRL